MKTKAFLSMVSFALLVACSALDNESDKGAGATARDFREDLFTIEQGNYRAVKEQVFDTKRYLIVYETDQIAGFGYQNFAFQKAGDTLHVYATPWKHRDCVKKMYSGKLESFGRDTYILNPLDGFRYFLVIKSILEQNVTRYKMELRTNDSTAASQQEVYLYLINEQVSKICES